MVNLSNLKEGEFMKYKTDILLIIEKCFYEYCYMVGGSPLGCDACPYVKFNTREKEDGCFKAYKEDKMKVFIS